MDYFQADKIGKRSLSDLMQDNWENQSIGKGIKNAMSDKMKAMGKRIGKNFTAMNMIKTLTGSNLLTAFYGKVTGKSKSDIAYFTGRKKPSSKRIGNIMALPGGNEQTASLLQSMFDFMVKSEESKQNRMQTERAFREERDNEEEQRHQQFLKALSAFTGVGAATKVEEKKDGGGFLDMIKSMLDALLKPFKWALDWLMNNKDLLLKLPALLGAAALPATILAGGVAATTFAAGVLASPMQESNRKALIANPMLGAMGGDTSVAAGIIQQSQPENKEKADRENAVLQNAPWYTRMYGIGRTEYLNKNLPKEDTVTNVQNNSNVNNINKVDNTSVNNTATPVTNTTNINLTTQMPKMTTPEPQETPVAPEQKATPVPTAPPMSRVNDAVTENVDLNLAEQTSSGGSDGKPIVMQNNNSTKLSDSPISATASTRNEVPILERVRSMSASPI